MQRPDLEQIAARLARYQAATNEYATWRGVPDPRPVYAPLAAGDVAALLAWVEELEALLQPFAAYAAGLEECESARLLADQCPLGACPGAAGGTGERGERRNGTAGPDGDRSTGTPGRTGTVGTPRPL